MRTPLACMKGHAQTTRPMYTHYTHSPQRMHRILNYILCARIFASVHTQIHITLELIKYPKKKSRIICYGTTAERPLAVFVSQATHQVVVFSRTNARGAVDASCSRCDVFNSKIWTFACLTVSSVRCEVCTPNRYVA